MFVLTSHVFVYLTNYTVHTERIGYIDTYIATLKDTKNKMICLVKYCDFKNLLKCITFMDLL